MYITADAILLSSDYKSDLTVCLQSHQSVNHMAPCFLQHLGPDNIILLVKTRLQLYQYRHLLSILCSLCQSCDDR